MPSAPAKTQTHRDPQSGSRSALTGEDRVQELGREIFARSTRHQAGILDKAFVSAKMMEWSMKYPAFKIEMFRFVDVLPALETPAQIADHIRQYFLRSDVDTPPVIRAGMAMASSRWGAKFAAGAVRQNVTAMAKTFITGEDSRSAKGTLEKLWRSGFCFTVDILGEAAVSDAEARHYQARYIELVEGLAREAKTWNYQPTLETAPHGVVPRANVSVKCSSLYSQCDNLAFDATVEFIKQNLRPVLRAAMRDGVFVNLDMEQNDFRNLFMTVAEHVFCEPEFEAYPHFGLVVQAYLLSASDDIERVKAFAARRSAPVTVRLVKGAYWDYEVIQAGQRNWPVPVFTQKAATDENYQKCTRQLLEAYPRVLSAFGSHNVRNIAYALSTAEELGLAKTAFELQMLFGMAEPFKKALAEMGYRVRDYAPVGEILPGMAYLVRRLLENTSNEGFLRASLVDKKEIAHLLAPPASRIRELSEKDNALKNSAAPQTPKKFENEPLRDFSRSENREAMERALKKVRAELPWIVLPQVDGRAREDVPVEHVANPSHLHETVTRFGVSPVALGEEAVRACEAHFRSWADTPVAQRCAIVRRAAQLMRDRKDELSATMVVEVGKNFREADADVAEAIDFCDYYAEQMERLARDNDMGSTPGESNRYLYRARGTSVAIAPWNFPLAILCGMTVGPLVAGNPVIMKPAEQSSAIAAKLYAVLREAGVPGGVLHLVPGHGEEVGRYLVQHPKVHIVSFTGSRAVGLQILQEAAKVGRGQRHLKKVVCELGGKNAIIVDDDADLDEAVVGALQSAFSFQGQKCSALSRLIVHESCYDKFKARFKEAMLSLKVGPAEDPTAKVGPVIDVDSRDRLRAVLERNADKIIGQVELPAALAATGHYVAPTLFESTDFHSELGQQEFFGPFVTLFKVKSFDEALRAMNDVDYALTGGIFSRSPDHLARAREEIEVGNLYINRGITGALVYKQPFGGFKLSGAGGKAGGPDYLLLFLEPRSVTENTMRRGFAPEIS